MSDDPSALLAALKLPANLTGKTILELGPANGYFTKQLDMRGADVTAMDYCAKRSLWLRPDGAPAREATALRPCQCVVDLDQQGFTPFDYVLCSGVLYHLPDMLRALWAIRALPNEAIDGLLATYDSGKFVYHPYKLRAVEREVPYGEIIIPLAYIERHWTDRFEIPNEASYESDPYQYQY